ncbi:ATPase associated with various cellular activities AAA_5 [Thermoanaerobacterium xylanolyticum LX-11]|uniref:ATPase associated with various cellular activities AAA_5 n=1 Tax=Thermoanaerobacterium xylanolyticum (strain ATCC 49914 / DSM 7097 / LX-11) TaxID=858215 RepID=F6BII6_THEXL|nr:AAA family ATPase [Thermoanaerobacterium xylanolyticum]AEF17785.1 ATPase associated with various cellular activities AAA_5 [Thermoanaerobacterium xylanolyticum LX-11]
MDDHVLEEIKKTCDKLLTDKKLLPLEQLNQGYNIFKEKFSPERLKSLDGELLIDTIFNIGNKDGLSYWLEFKNDDEFKTNSNSYGSISGGSSYKFIMFKRSSDGKWVTGNPQNPTILSIDKAVELGRKIRDALVAGANLIDKLSDDASIEDYIKLQEQLSNTLVYNKQKLGWVHKYYHMLYPNKIDAFHSTRWQVHALICCNIKPVQDDKLYTLSGQLMQITKKTGLPTSYVMNSMCVLFGPPVNYFRIGTGDNGNSYWEDMKSNSYVGIGWAKLGNLTSYDESKSIKEDIAQELKKLYGYDNNVASRKVGEIIRFYRDIEIGDVVVAVLGEKVLGIGKVVGNYEYVKDRPYSHCRNVEWVKIFKEPVHLPKTSTGKLTACFQYRDINNIFEIRRLMNEESDEIMIKPILKPLTGTVAEIEGVLARKKQVILYGPPGTGKTYYAEKACSEFAARSLFHKPYDSLSQNEKALILGDSTTNGYVRMCCFHPSYGYEDFIEGIKPRIVNNQTVFELKDGIFKRICKDAMENSDKNFYLIIDEINRGDISRIFGELITLIEVGKRGKEVILPLSNESFKVPDNVYIVGTMNTADRSIALLDVALRRRFGFIELMPDYSLFDGVAFEGLPLAEWLKELNSRICENLGKDACNLQIGHSYFLEKEKPIIDNEKFKRIIKEDIIPLIEEYCYGDYELISKILGESIVDVKNQTIRYELFDTPDISDLVTALLSPCPDIRIGVETTNDDIADEDNDSEDNQNNSEES